MKEEKIKKKIVSIIRKERKEKGSIDAFIKKIFYNNLFLSPEEEEKKNILQMILEETNKDFFKKEKFFKNVIKEFKNYLKECGFKSVKKYKIADYEKGYCGFSSVNNTIFFNFLEISLEKENSILEIFLDAISLLKQNNFKKDKKEIFFKSKNSFFRYTKKESIFPQDEKYYILNQFLTIFEVNNK